MTQFFISFCAGCILLGSLYIICPEGNISKSVKYVFSLVCLVIIISAANIPLENMDFSPNKETISKANYNEMQISAAEYVYGKTLKAQDINFSKIYIYTDNSENGSVSFLQKISGFI
jgi:hypothetical protein